MSPEILQQLRALSPVLRETWEAGLRLAPINGPLANPDTLRHLIPDSLRRIFLSLARPSRAPLSLQAARARLPACDCGNNPYLAYFTTGEQALMEIMVRLQARMPPLERRQSDLAEVVFAVRRLANSEIDAFCGVCTHRGTASNCRHAVAMVG